MSDKIRQTVGRVRRSLGVKTCHGPTRNRRCIKSYVSQNNEHRHETESPMIVLSYPKKVIAILIKTHDVYTTCLLKIAFPYSHANVAFAPQKDTGVLRKSANNAPEWPALVSLRFSPCNIEFEKTRPQHESCLSTSRSIVHGSVQKCPYPTMTQNKNLTQQMAFD
jgi:hypothetical protein